MSGQVKCMAVCSMRMLRSLKINNILCKRKTDTGTSVTVIPEEN